LNASWTCPFLISCLSTFIAIWTMSSTST
jgi:hypothetical protein